MTKGAHRAAFSFAGILGWHSGRKHEKSHRQITAGGF
jgi:hypothetical protein